MFGYEEELQDEITKLKAENEKLFAIPDVRQQSELLKAFCSMLLNAGDLTQQISDDDINSFLKAFNCT